MTEALKTLKDFRARFNRAWKSLNWPEKKKNLKEWQAQMSRPNFWQKPEQARDISQKAAEQEAQIKIWEELKKDLEDLSEMSQMDQADASVDLQSDIAKQLAVLEKKFTGLESQMWFQNPYDTGDALVMIHAGAGGTDAQDWANMLLRMYLRFCEQQKWKTAILNVSSGQEAGVKSVLFSVTGAKAYGYLKAESGVHRLVRISPFDAEKMRHTSFAMVEVLPLMDEVTEVVIKPEDLKVETFRAGGHGGQSVNTTDSAVRLTHKPTGLSVSCQNERSQAQNKALALKVLKSKLRQYFETELEEERQRLRGEYTEAAWGNQIRSYVLQPYKMIKDHRTDFETSQVEKVLDGDLGELIEAYLRKNVKI